ncbi:MAG: hypothetical protein M9904_08020 [Chitinophagaceae bacterium]|nr:hypothetical protein [Chitinophagaceae bacterium]
MKDKQNIIIYKTQDGKATVSLYARDGSVWMNQQQLAELFDTSVPNISMHISNIMNDNELNEKSVIKEYLTTAADGKIIHYYQNHVSFSRGQENDKTMNKAIEIGKNNFRV